MNVLITGASSLLGKALLQTFPKQANLTLTWFSNYVGIPMYQMNVCDKLQVGYIFERCKPDLVIHCAAIGSVDYAEKFPRETYEVNVNGTMNVAEWCKRYHSRLVYISTNAVYDGKRPPYNEMSERNPVNRYGMIKKEAEDKITESFDNWVIIRPFLLFGWTYAGARQNWVNIVMKKLMAGEQLKLVNDVYWQPTLAEEVARIIWQVSILGSGEAYNIAPSDRMTLYEFGQLVAKTWHLRYDLLVPVPASEFAGMAPRPVDTTYDTTKLSQLGIKVKGTEEGLKGMR